jgi:hypothetical protein
LLQEAYHWDLWAAAHIINGGRGNDGFMDFRRWLISRGERAFYATLNDPESLAQWQEGEDNLFFEPFGWVCREAMAISSGDDLIEAMKKRTRRASPSKPRVREPRGTRWKNDGELASRFPKLYARSWGNDR